MIHFDGEALLEPAPPHAVAGLAGEDLEDFALKRAGAVFFDACIVPLLTRQVNRFGDVFLNVLSHLWYYVRMLKRLSNLQAARKKRGFVQEDLAALTGISRSTIAELETGGRKARRGTTERLAAALRTTPGKLY